MIDSPSLVPWLLSVVYTGGALCVGAAFLLYMYQDQLLYFPTIPGTPKLTRDNPPGYRNPGEFSIEYEDLTISCKDGVKINAWLMKQKEYTTRPTFIFFHGNAGNIGYRLPNAVRIFRKVKVNVLLVDYRGFGHSEGNPTEEGIKLDAVAVLDAMYSRTDIDSSKIVVFGRSLGGAVSIYLAEKESSRVAGVILENTFLSISAMVDALMPFLTIIKPLVLRIGWNSMQDELVPHSHMEKLHSLATSSKRAVWYPVPGGSHNDSWLRGGDKYYSEIRQFLDTLISGSVCLEIDGSSSISYSEDENSIPSMLQQPILGSLLQTE